MLPFEDKDSPTAKAMRLFRQKDARDYKVRGLADRLDYPLFKADDDLRGKVLNQEHGLMVPKGNPYHISLNTEVLLTKGQLLKDREKQETYDQEVQKIAGNMVELPIQTPGY